MKAEDIIRQLQIALPKATNAFSDEIDIISLTSSGTTATAVTSSPHNLTTGDYVNVMGALTPNIITELTSADDVATAVTTDWHDLTEGWQQTVEITGADQAEYNGTNNLLTVPNRKTFTYEISGSPVSPATGTPIFWYNFPIGYNGWKEVTVIDSTTIEYDLERPFGSPAAGTIKMQTKARISGAVSVEKAADSYTKQNDGKLWGFIVLSDMVANKSRTTRDDDIITVGKGEAYRQKIIHPFTIYVMVPATSTISSRAQRDSMEELLIPICSSILRVKFPTGFTEDPFSGVVFSNHGFYAYNNAVYIHQFAFETQGWIVYDDTSSPDYNVAFRDIFVDYIKLTDDGILMTQHVNLDEEPLE